eukprot:snap_masked-scaffold_36-processed-gene-2.82-mRNA-1 protein AED:1.00 eAED:1.00 QI:0/0/0/0/1/1/2/0/67
MKDFGGVSWKRTLMNKREETHLILLKTKTKYIEQVEIKQAKNQKNILTKRFEKVVKVPKYSSKVHNK